MTPDKVVSVGIDLGTTYSSMSFAAVKVSNGFPIPVPQLATDTTGSRIEHQFIPSLVCAYVEGKKVKWAIGNEALRISETYGDRAHLFHSFKLFLGTNLPEKERRIELQGIPIEIDPGDLAKRLIRYMKDLAFGPNGQLEGFEIGSITVSTPARWEPDRKRYIQNIVRDVFPGTKVQALEEPIGALYYQISSAGYLLTGPEKYVMVVDYGGGTCDVAVVKIQKNADRIQSESKKVAEVIGRGSMERGGIILDIQLAKHLRTEANKEGVRVSMDELLLEAEKMKIALSNQLRDKRNSINSALKRGNSSILAYEAFRHYGKKGIILKISENKFTKLFEPELNKIQDPITQALNEASELTGKKVTHQDIQHVFLAGGTTLLPLVKDKIESIFKSKGLPVSVSEHEPRFAIVYGNALHAYHIDTSQGFGLGITLQKSVWLESAFGTGILIAKKGASLPYRYQDTPFTIGRIEEVKTKLLTGPHFWVSKDESISGTITLRLTKPVGLVNRFRVNITIHESGIMDFELRRVNHSQDFVMHQNLVPISQDIEEMKSRAGMELIEERKNANFD